MILGVSMILVPPLFVLCGSIFVRNFSNLRNLENISNLRNRFLILLLGVSFEYAP